MNDLEKKSFHLFLAIYLISTMLLISISFFWYYNSQKNILERLDFQRLNHIADTMAGEIIIAHMNKETLPIFSNEKNCLNSQYICKKSSCKAIKDDVLNNSIKLAFLNKKGELIKGDSGLLKFKNRNGYFFDKDYSILVSSSTRGHLGVDKIIIKSNMLSLELASLKRDVLLLFLVSTILIVIIAYILAKIFLKPINIRIKQIEHFIDDITHELNTPISSLLMSVSIIKNKLKVPEAILDNILISTKQLQDIYKSLSYLNFNLEKSQDLIRVDEALKDSLKGYELIAKKKRIEIKSDIKECSFKMDRLKATLLFNNLISNAIKYSYANSVVEIELNSCEFIIKDYGVGIKSKNLDEIFKRYKRATKYSGGFGIGLNIVKNISNEYNIKLYIESKENKGTTFKLIF